MRVVAFFSIEGLRCPTGVTRHGLEVIRALARDVSIDLTLLCSSNVPEPAADFQHEIGGQCRIRHFPTGTATLLRRWLILGAPPIENYVGEVDVVYSPAEYFVPSRAAAFVPTVHDVSHIEKDLYSFKHRLVWRWKLKRVVHHAHTILSVSEFTKSRLEHFFPQSGSKTFVVGNGIDRRMLEPPSKPVLQDLQQAKGFPLSNKYFLHLGALVLRKNLGELVAAFSEFRKKRRDFWLILAGSAPEAERGRLMRHAQSLGCADRVISLGYVNEDQKRALLKGAEAVVIPSRYEGFCIPALEAMAAEVPVIASRTTALPEVIGEAGWWYSRGDAGELAEVMLRVMDSRTERDEKIRLGRAIAREHHWENVGKQVLGALRRAFSETKGLQQPDERSGPHGQGNVRQSRLTGS